MSKRAAELAAGWFGAWRTYELEWLRRFRLQLIRGAPRRSPGPSLNTA